MARTEPVSRRVSGLTAAAILHSMMEVGVSSLDRQVGVVLSKLHGFLKFWLLHAQRLFQLLVGVAFLCLALAGAHVALAEWLFYRREPASGLLRFYLVAGFTVVLILFSLYSFAKARSVR